MAITTYDTLKSAIANWTNRDDLTSYLDEFIDITESKMNRKLRLSEMETRATSTANTEYLALPDDYLEVRNVQLNVNPVIPLEYLSPYQIDMYTDSATGQPKYYSVIGDEIQLYPAPDGNYTIEITYYKKITPLDGTNTTNFVLEEWPDLYLSGCLQQAFTFLMNPDSAMMHGQEFERLIAEISKQSRSRKYSGSPMIVIAS